jgi:hypothetical protein
MLHQIIELLFKNGDDMSKPIVVGIAEMHNKKRNWDEALGGWKVQCS